MLTDAFDAFRSGQRTKALQLLSDWEIAVANDASAAGTGGDEFAEAKAQQQRTAAARLRAALASDAVTYAVSRTRELVGRPAAAFCAATFEVAAAASEDDTASVEAQRKADPLHPGDDGDA